MTRAPLRGARLRATAYHVELYGWIVGDPTFLETLGQEPKPRLERGPVARRRWALMMALEYEHLGMTLGGATSASIDPTQGHYSVDTFGAGLDAWGTSHVRITADHVSNYIDGTSAQVRANHFHRRAEHEVLVCLGMDPWPDSYCG